MADSHRKIGYHLLRPSGWKVCIQNPPYRKSRLDGVHSRSNPLPDRNMEHHSHCYSRRFPGLCLFPTEEERETGKSRSAPSSGTRRGQGNREAGENRGSQIQDQ